MKLSSVVVIALASASYVQGFSAVPPFGATRTTAVSQSSSLSMAKGFGQQEEAKKPEKSEGQVKRERESSKYDELAATGGQEYSVYVRQFGSDDDSWLPCGAIAVPRGAQVTDAIYSNDEALKVAITRTYPKLKGFEDEFEFGFNLKLYPDDPVEVAVKGTPKKEGFSVGNWLSLLLSPVDAAQPKPPTN